MQRVILLVSGVSVLLLLVVLLRLASLEAGGPVHWDLQLQGDIPATMYLPDGPERDPSATRRRFRPEPPPPGERPLGVVLVHGFASDRRNMSPLARSLARAGYAVLAVDVAGHGENRREGGIRGGRSGRSSFYSELEAAVQFLRRSPFVDGERIVMMGHSMGAGATLGYGTWDPTLDGVVMIAGGWRGSGPHRPPNALFLYAEGDSMRLHEIDGRQRDDLGLGLGAHVQHKRPPALLAHATARLDRVDARERLGRRARKRVRQRRRLGARSCVPAPDVGLRGRGAER